MTAKAPTQAQIASARTIYQQHLAQLHQVAGARDQLMRTLRHPDALVQANKAVAQCRVTAAAARKALGELLTRASIAR